ncbi:L-rhamnose mutarotase [Georgenia sp. SUBG003]|uniref:L-rhamnose mutarotase n=1 Tax=Georgenia sp. SUBG003 TaxID=1497974 RepID=UPI000B1D9EBB
MQRICFLARIRPELADEYRERHAAVWPEMLRALESAGWGNYSLFLADDGTLVGYLETEDFAAARAAVAGTDVNARWQTEMSRYFVNAGSGRPDESFVPLEEVFHLQDQLAAVAPDADRAAAADSVRPAGGHAHEGER